MLLHRINGARYRFKSKLEIDFHYSYTCKRAFSASIEAPKEYMTKTTVVSNSLVEKKIITIDNSKIWLRKHYNLTGF